MTSTTVPVANDLRLTPQAKTVLHHLRTSGAITPMKALVIYSISRLAPCIYEIRRAGYDVISTVRRDEQNHRYTKYTLAGR